MGWVATPVSSTTTHYSVVLYSLPLCPINRMCWMRDKQCVRVRACAAVQMVNEDVIGVLFEHGCANPRAHSVFYLSLLNASQLGEEAGSAVLAHLPARPVTSRF